MSYILISTTEDHISYFKGKELTISITDRLSFSIVKEHGKGYTSSVIKEIDKSNDSIQVTTINNNIFLLEEN